MSKQNKKLREQYKKDCNKDKLSEGELETMIKQIKTKSMEQDSKQRNKEQQNSSYTITLERGSRRRQLMREVVSVAAALVIVVSGIFAIKGFTGNNGGDGDMVPGASDPAVQESIQPEGNVEDVPVDGEVIWRAIVLKATDKYLYVSNINQGESVRQFETVSVSYDNADIICKAGDLIKITFDGTILETYPGQIIAKEIEVVEAMKEEVIPLLSLKEVNYTADINYVSDKDRIDGYENSLRMAAAEGDALFINYQIPGKQLTEIDEEEAAENTKAQIDRFIGDIEMNVPSYLPVVQIHTEDKKVHPELYVFDGEKIHFYEIDASAEEEENPVISFTSKKLYSAKLEDGRTAHYISKNGTVKNEELEAYVTGAVMGSDFRVMYVEEASQN